MCSASRPRSLSNSSTSRNESEYRRYQRTAQRISSGSVCRQLKITDRIVFFMISSGYKLPSAKVATQPFKQFTDNEEFRRWLTDNVFGLTYAPPPAENQTTPLD